MMDRELKIRILERACEIIATPLTWTRLAVARDCVGYSTDPRSKQAVCWCATGALFKAAHELGKNEKDFEHRKPIATEVGLGEEVRPGKYLWNINDEFGREEVLAVMRARIAELKEEG